MHVFLSCHGGSFIISTKPTLISLKSRTKPNIITAKHCKFVLSRWHLVKPALPCIQKHSLSVSAFLPAPVSPVTLHHHQFAAENTNYLPPKTHNFITIDDHVFLYFCIYYTYIRYKYSCSFPQGYETCILARASATSNKTSIHICIYT